MDLNIIWFFVMGVLLTGYAILDGFDLGVGILHFTARTDKERRVLMNSIGPLWDGNEVWLVTFGGALFAAFPIAYATVFQTFYTPFMMLLCGLIFRAVSMEFRSKQPHPWWRTAWDIAFCASSTLVALLFGIAVGNIMQGIAIDGRAIYQGGFFDFLNPFSLLTGILVVALFAMHGAIFLHLKTTGDLQTRIRAWVWRCFFLFLVLYVLTTVFALARLPKALHNFETLPAAWIIVVLNVLAIANIPRAMHQRRPGFAFFSSACTIAAFNFLFAIAMFPNMVVSSLDPAFNIDIYNAASSQKTLGIMLLIACLGMPCVLAYTVIIYWLFRGKVELGKFSY